MSHKSEEQWELIGTCPDCGANLYLMGDRVAHDKHTCPYIHMDELVDSIIELSMKIKPCDPQQLVKDILNV